MTTAIVNKIIPFSSVDGPGNRTAVFLQGCGFNCKYCHNPETISKCKGCGICVKHCPKGALSMVDGNIVYDAKECILCDECIHSCPNLSSPRTSVMTPMQVMERVRKNMPFIRGITVSGGECTLWRDFLLELLTLAKESGLETMLDSNGSYSFASDDELMAVTDGVMLDIKAWDDIQHYKLTQNHNDVVKQNLKYLLETGKLFEVRTVIVPGLIDAVETVDKTSQTVAKYSSKVRYKIIKYRDNGVRPEFKSIQAPDDELLKELEAIARKNGLTDIVLI